MMRNFTEKALAAAVILTLGLFLGSICGLLGADVQEAMLATIRDMVLLNRTHIIHVR